MNIEFLPQTPPIWQTQLAFDLLPGDTSATFATELMIDGNPLAGLVFVSIDIGQPNPEYILGNLSGDVLTFTVRNAKPLEPDISSGAFTSTHRAGAVVKITDFGSIQMLRNILQGLKPVSNPLISPSPAVLPNDVPNFRQLQDAIVAGGVPATTVVPGISMIAENTDIASGTDQRPFNATIYPLFVQPSQVRNVGLRSFLAAEDIDPLDAVYLGTFTPGGVPTLDTFTLDTPSPGAPLTTYPFTVGNNPQRLLIVCVSAPSAGDVSGVTYNGVAMTNIGNSHKSGPPGDQSTLILFKLIAPTVGTSNIVISGTVNISHSVAYSYYNVDQITGIDVVTTTNTSNYPTTLVTTTLENDAIVFGAFSEYGVGASGSLVGDITVKFNSVTSSHIANYPLAFGAGDSSNIAVAGAVTGVFTSNFGISFTPQGFISIQCAIKPGNASVLGLKKASAATVPESEMFIGFAPVGGLQNTLIDVITTGYVDGFSGLANDIYYLQDADGTIGTTPGTETKNVGIAVSPTTLLIQNI